MLIFSVLADIATIVSALCGGDMTVEAIVAIIVLGILLLIFMIRDWYYSFLPYRVSSEWNVFGEINKAYSKTREDEIKDAKDASRLLNAYCDSISDIFTKIKGQRIGVCVKLLVKDEDGLPILISQARDTGSKNNGRKTGSYDETKHYLKSNSDFSFIHEKGHSCFHSDDLANEENYTNTRLVEWSPPQKFPLIPQRLLRRHCWPLQYISTIVVPIWPLNCNFENKDKLRGFLCVDSRKTKTFNKSADVEMLRGMAEEITPIIDRLNELSRVLDNSVG